MQTLLPLALDVLAADPRAEGDLYPGDLMAAVRRVPDTYWAEHPDQATRWAAIRT
ncbi:contact-dependent growth inhibition system immunity protein [Tenggerimyces flavus]|uniref:Contact-dependent growth inhibition system immunity protein n=1 Tax=Tenggerimyces flavus TaxID=1708749 RepID=A0ABV7YPJ5_9ACTN|nr:contact-dependent growth inhibition system immunity protein [Tenggerimyces flavus]MBM7788768.1 hypothetical protein [Tenggerimyces flavus]